MVWMRPSRRPCIHIDEGRYGLIGDEIVLTHTASVVTRGSERRGCAVIRVVAVLSGHDRSRIGQGSYSLLHRKVVDAFVRLHDVNVHYLATFAYLGFDQPTIEVAHSERFDGKAPYTFRKLASNAIDGIITQSLSVVNLAVSIGMSLSTVDVGVVYLLIVTSFVALPGFTSMAVMVRLTPGSY